MPVYKDVKRNTWFCKIRCTDWQGNKKETTRRGFATKRAAKEFEEEYMRKMAGSADMSLQSLTDIYLEDRKQHIKESSLSMFAMTFRTYILPYLGEKKLSDLSPNAIRQWQNHLATVTKKDGSLLRPSTIQTINRRLSSLLAFAVKFYGLPRNPMAVTGNPGKMEKRLDFWEKAEFDQFIEAVQHPLYRSLFILLFYSGMRIGEALALEKKDISGNNISITKTRDRAGNITTPKTKASIRTISLPDIAMSPLQAVCDGLPDVQQIFPITYTTCLYHYRRAVRASGVRPLTIHALRHAHASLLLAKGVPVTAVSKRLGHTSPQITLSIYSHATQDSEKLITDTLNAL
jgi:integrase